MKEGLLIFLGFTGPSMIGGIISYILYRIFSKFSKHKLDYLDKKFLAYIFVLFATAIAIAVHTSFWHKNVVIPLTNKLSYEHCLETFEKHRCDNYYKINE